MPEELGQAVYAVVQESLTNVLRHARAARAVVTLAREGEDLVVSIQDDGPGPGGVEAGGADSVPTGPGMGIPGMRGRVEALGGTLETGRASGFLRVRAGRPRDGGPAMIRVALIDDQPLVLMGLSTLIGTEDDLELVGQAGDGGGTGRAAPDPAGRGAVRHPDADSRRAGLLAEVAADPS